MATHTDSSNYPPPGRAALWGGRVLAVLVGAFLTMSAVMKLTGSPELTQGMAHLGLALDVLPTLAAIELACVVLYLIPHTAILGAILLTGYLGGAILAHLRVGDPVMTPVLIGVVAWLAIWLREPRLRRILPVRSV